MVSNNKNFDLARELAKSAKEKFSKNVIGIYAVESKRKNNNEEIPDLDGTGFLVRAKTKTFVFTAKHVLETRHHLGRGTLALAPGRSGQNLIKLILQESVYVCSGDKDDVGIVELFPKHEEELLRHNEIAPMSVSHLFPEYKDKETDGVLMLGFPGEMTRRIVDWRNKPGVSSTAIPYLTMLTTNPNLPKSAGFNPARDLTLIFDKENSVNEIDTPWVPPDPVGMSGAPLIALRPKSPLHELWTPNEIEVIGICKKWYEEENIICATRIGVALELAKKQWPEEF